MGFEKAKGPVEAKDTDAWPVQSFQWKDVVAPRKAKFRYRIYAVKGTADHTVPDKKPIVVTRWVSLQEQFGSIRVVFNRGLISTQAMSNLIREGKTFQIPSMMQVGKAVGMVSLNDALMDLVTKKLVAPDEAYAKAVDKSGFEALLKRANIDTKNLHHEG